MLSTIVLGAAAFAGLAAAQDAPQYGYPYTIVPDSVDISNRDQWCLMSQTQCPLICLQVPGVTSMTTESNDCDPEALTYSCVCENGVAPNITQYSQTLPYFICREWGTQCQQNCGNDNTCASKCTSDHPCGALDPYKGNQTLASQIAASASAAATATSKPPTVGFAGQTDAASPANGAASASFLPGAGVSLFAVAGSIFMGFGLLL